MYLAGRGDADGDGSPSRRAPVRFGSVRFAPLPLADRQCASRIGCIPALGTGPDQARYDEQPQQGRDESEPHRSSVPS
jgi:hypothetical protein